MHSIPIDRCIWTVTPFLKLLPFKHNRAMVHPQQAASLHKGGGRIPSSQGSNTYRTLVTYAILKCIGQLSVTTKARKKYRTHHSQRRNWRRGRILHAPRPTDSTGTECTLCYIRPPPASSFARTIEQGNLVKIQLRVTYTAGADGIN